MKELEEFLWKGLEEEYWRALVSQGEHPSETVPPLADSVVLERLVGSAETGDPPTSSTPLSTASFTVNKGIATDDWSLAQRAYENGEILRLPVIGCNWGGLLVRLNGLKGFVPASHLLSTFHSDTEPRQKALARWIGQELSLKIIELDTDQSRLILSERAARQQDPDSLLNSLAPGDVCTGRVSKVCPFGAFVDLGGLEGLLHVSEISWCRVNHPGDALKPGDEIKVYVVDVDRKRRRVALSMKRLQPDPWSLVEQRYQVGQLVEGVVTNVVSFGAFVRVEEGVEGLVHISELAEGHFLHPRNVVKEGDQVRARILSIDSRRHRLGLSLRQVWNAPRPADARHPATP